MPDAIAQAGLVEGTLYIFGAGTSRWTGAPLIADFKEAALSLKIGEDEAGIPRYVASKVGNAKFRKALDLWEQRAPDSNIEEFYVLAELLNSLENWSSEEEDTGEAAQERLHCVQYLIAKTLQETVKGEAQQEKIHDLMLSGIQGPLVPATLPSAIITLNWDISLEHAAARVGLPIDLGLTEGKANRRALKLLKLHGSLNWLYNHHTETTSIDSEAKSIVDVWDHAPFHDLMNSGEEPLFVPPTTEKLTVNSGPLRSLWRQAQLKLGACRRLVIVGYSFPPGDVQFRMFLLQALQQNSLLESIVVVNAPAYGTRRQQFEDHYAAMFSGSRHFGKLRFQYTTYEDWARARCPLE